jgi:putative Holliday junction resolvase
MVVIAIDYGEKKIGLAVGNTETMTSSPISIIIGKPLNMDGTRSDFMEKVERFAKKLRSIIDIEIEFFDERLTSFEARQLDEDSEMIDDVAAKIILDSWLNNEHS